MSQQSSRSNSTNNKDDEGTFRTIMSWGRRVKVQSTAPFDQEKEKIAAQV